MTKRWMTIAEREIGTKEIRGAKHNPRVIEYHAATDYSASDDETAWCASFVNWVLEQADMKGTRSPAARSFSSWGVESKLQKGAVVVLKRGNSSWQGHVGFVDHWDESYVYVLGGNQSNAVNVQSFPRSKVIAVRMPKAVSNSKTVAASSVGGVGVMGLAALEEIKPMVSELSTQFDWAHYLLAGITLAALGFVMYERIKKIRKQGV